MPTTAQFTKAEYRGTLECAMNETAPGAVARRSDGPSGEVVDARRQPEGAHLWQRIIATVSAARSSIGRVSSPSAAVANFICLFCFEARWQTNAKVTHSS
jgi:hypothetical protein